MGCGPISSKVKPSSDNAEIEYTANSRKLPPQVLEGFGAILKSYARSNAQLKKYSSLVTDEPANKQKHSTIADKNINDSEKREIEEIKEKLSNDTSAPLNIYNNKEEEKRSEINQVAIDLQNKRKYIKRTLLHKITMKSQFKIGKDIKNNFDYDEGEESHLYNESNLEKKKHHDQMPKEIPNEEKPLLNQDGSSRLGLNIVPADFGDAEEDIPISVQRGDDENAKISS